MANDDHPAGQRQCHMAHQPGHRPGQAPAVSSLRPRQVVRDRLLRLAGHLGRARRIQFQLQPGIATPAHHRESPRMVRTRSRLRDEQPELVAPADHRARGLLDYLVHPVDLAAQPRQFHVPSLCRAQQSRDRRPVEQIRRRGEQPVRLPSRARPHLHGPDAVVPRDHDSDLHPAR